MFSWLQFVVHSRTEKGRTERNMLDIVQNKCGLIYTLVVIFCASIFVFRLDFRRARLHKLRFNSSCGGAKLENDIFENEIHFTEIFEQEIPMGWSKSYEREKKLELQTVQIISKFNGSE